MPSRLEVTQKDHKDLDDPKFLTHIEQVCGVAGVIHPPSQFYSLQLFKNHGIPSGDRGIILCNNPKCRHILCPGCFRDNLENWGSSFNGYCPECKSGSLTYYGHETAIRERLLRSGGLMYHTNCTSLYDYLKNECGRSDGENLWRSPRSLCYLCCSEGCNNGGWIPIEDKKERLRRLQPLATPQQDYSQVGNHCISGSKVRTSREEASTLLICTNHNPPKIFCTNCGTIKEEQLHDFYHNYQTPVSVETPHICPICAQKLRRELPGHSKQNPSQQTRQAVEDRQEELSKLTDFFWCPYCRQSEYVRRAGSALIPLLMLAPSIGIEDVYKFLNSSGMETVGKSAWSMLPCPHCKNGNQEIFFELNQDQILWSGWRSPKQNVGIVLCMKCHYVGCPKCTEQRKIIEPHEWWHCPLCRRTATLVYFRSSKQFHRQSLGRAEDLAKVLRKREVLLERVDKQTSNYTCHEDGCQGAEVITT